MTDLKVELQEVKEESDSQATAPGGGAVAKRRSWPHRLAWAGTAAVILAAITAVTLWRLWRHEVPSPTVVQLSSERYAGSGSFSPDGTQIAFASSGDKGDNVDIWLKIVGEAEARRLTTDPAAEDSPAWSPDGTQIAFLRHAGVTGRRFVGFWAPGAIYLVSPLGGPQRRLSDFPARLQLSWSPDGRWLAASRAPGVGEAPVGIYLISPGSGEPRAVTFPKPPAFDVCPSFSPDGRRLAYASCEGAVGNPVCDVYVLPLDSQLRPESAARPLTRQRLWNHGVAWTRDGRSIVYGGGSYLWRVRADGDAPPERLELAGRAGSPSTASSRDRLAFVRGSAEPHIYRLRLGCTPTVLLEAALGDMFPQYSPDGRRIAFQSERAGDVAEIWLADADGSNPARLTRGPGRFQGSPRWSPDGRSIVFDSYAESGHADIWTIGVDGSGLRQITHDPADDMIPSWSRDGRFIYFASNRTGRNEVWRIPVGGGAEDQLTREGGAYPSESLDGRILYYARGDGALVSRPMAGAEEQTVARCAALDYAVAPGGLFHVDCVSPDAADASLLTLRYWDAVTGQDRSVATLETAWLGGLAVSPDGRSVLYGRSSSTSDLMMIENFR
jgi:Tol biopolymer transport system component